MPEPRPPVLTIGHSVRPIGEFIGMLQAHGVTRVVDVRTIPRSRRNPQFDQSRLPGSLLAAGIGYTHMPELGGLRKARPDSVNTGWRNASFRGYADYMQSAAFTRAIEELIGMSEKDRLALMCAEAVPWRCHRSLVADALLVRGIPSEDISSRTRRQPHQLTPFARVEGTRVTYPAGNASPEPPVRKPRAAQRKKRSEGSLAS